MFMEKPVCVSAINRLRIGAFVLLAAFVILSCDQMPVFYNISQESSPRSAVIPGSPQNMVVTSRSIYAWNRENIWRFSGPGWKWERVSVPARPIGGVAAVDHNGRDYLYAVVHSGGSRPQSQIWMHDGDSWSPINPAGIDNISGFSIGLLFTAKDQFFARAQSGSSYHILRFVPDPTSGELTAEEVKVTTEKGQVNDSSINLSGAVEMNGDIYLATAQSGVFKIDPDIGGALTPIAPSSDFVVTGILAVGDKIAVAGNTRDAGRLYELEGSMQNQNEWPDPKISDSGTFFNGGMTVWREFVSEYTDPSGLYNDWKPLWLLAGVRTTTRNVNGYREIPLVLEDDRWKISAPSRIPGDSNDPKSSVVNRARYRANIGIRSVRFILQSPNLGGNFYPSDMTKNEGWQPPIFASTSIDGLWSYNFRHDEWNADDNSITWQGTP